MKPVSKRTYIKGKKVTVSIRLPKELKDKLEKLASESGRGFSDFVQEGLDQWATLHKNEEAASANARLLALAPKLLAHAIALVAKLKQERIAPMRLMPALIDLENTITEYESAK